jgi:hypothetical protein
MSDFRSTRVGITNAARLLNVSVSKLKESARNEAPIKGVMPPKPIGYLGTSAKEMYFNAGEIMDCAEEMKGMQRSQ